MTKVPLICLSPALLDHSFPKDDHELARVSAALGGIQECLEADKLALLMTDYLGMIASEVDYTRIGECPILREVISLIQQWVLQPHDGMEQVDATGVEGYEPHPAPLGSHDRGLVIIWQDELGRLLCLHDAVCRTGEYFIGIACDFAFAGGHVGKLENPERRRCFPLVGPSQLGALSSGYEYRVSQDAHRQSVRLADVFRNYRYIGATGIRRPNGGSHYHVEFNSRRPWPLDTKIDPIPDDHLRTLSDTTELPVPVLKDSLCNGRPPERVCRLPQRAESLVERSKVRW